jgi:vacuolar-type H+-ATPase subunit I/STV1
MPEKTRFLARLIGLYCLLAALVMAVQREAWTAAVTALVHDPPLMLLSGVCVVAAGLALVLAHNVWSGGALPVVVTVIGWLTLLKGLMLWVLTPAAAADFYLERLRYGELYYLYCAFSFAVGLYLAAAGFASGRRTAP